MYRVLKRDGSTVEFDISKISAAMIKAFEALEKTYHPSVINLLALQVTSDFEPKIKDEQIAVEELFWNTNVTTGIRVAEARGVILLCAQQKGLVMQEYTPMQVKQAVVGYGKAEKKQVITMVTMMLGLPKPPKPDDTADALAIAVCHAHSAGSALAQYYNKP